MPTNCPVKGLFYVGIQFVGVFSLVNIDYSLNLKLQLYISSRSTYDRINKG